MTKNQTNNDEIKKFILDVVEKQKPENIRQIIAIIQERYDITPEQTTNLLVELENEERLNLTMLEPLAPSASVKAYLLSQKALWYWTTIVLAATTTVSVYAIPDSAVPLVYIRSALGLIFVLFLPGYALIKTLLPVRIFTETKSEEIENIVRMALSIGMSFALVTIVGLVVNYTPWGIMLTPIMLSLLALTAVFATVAVIREHQIETTQTK